MIVSPTTGNEVDLKLFSQIKQFILCHRKVSYFIHDSLEPIGPSSLSLLAVYFS